MPLRRHIVVASALALAAPYVLRRPARAASPIVRRDVMDMKPDDRFFSDYAKAVAKMHSQPDGRAWLAQAKIHADYCKHGRMEFLHWHRHYLRFFEQICASLSGNPDFALAYWNWSKNGGRLPAPFFDLTDLNVEHWNDPGNYTGKAWGPIDTVGRRGLDKTHGVLDDPVRGGAFTLQNINIIKQQKDINLFRPMLEGQPHNNGHVVAGATKTGKTGHIGSGLSPLDPIFWLHHCMVDRIWAEWQAAGNTTPDPGADYGGNFVDADGKAAAANSTGAMDIAKMGYTYDVLQPKTAGIASERVDLQQVQHLKSLLAGQPRVVASAAGETARANIETAFSVTVPELPKRALELQSLEASGLVVNSGQVLARLSEVTVPQGGDLVVNVFVNCNYLSPQTPYNDPYYAGTFSFFGASQTMPDMPEMNSRTFVVDITRPVRQAQLALEQIKLQLMPLPAATGADTSATFKVGKVEILSV